MDSSRVSREISEIQILVRDVPFQISEAVNPIERNMMVALRSIDDIEAKFLKLQEFVKKNADSLKLESKLSIEFDSMN